MDENVSNTMEILDPGSIKIYETDLVAKVEKMPLLERLTSEASLAEDEIDFNDDFYQRIYDLADSVQKELSKKTSPQKVKEEEDNKKSTDDSTPSDQSLAEAMKIKKGLEKIRQLDSRLSDLMKKEKEIKRRRSGNSETKESINCSISDTSFGSEPLFVTQPREKDDTVVVVECMESETHTGENGTVSDEKVKRKTNEGHFIERNKELASEGTQPVLMTEAEKKRLEELLEEEGEREEESYGFVYSKEDLDKLTNIDKELDVLVPALSTVPSPAMSQTSSERPPGEKVLISIQENRHEQNRLKDINKQLEMLKSDEEEIKLTDEVLQYLIEQSKIEQNSQHFTNET